MEAARPAGKTRKKRIRAEKGGIDLTFMFLVLILLAIGLIMLFSASYASAYYETGNSFYYISRQLLFAIVGIIGMFVVANIDYHILHRFAFLIYIGTVFLLILVLFVHTREDARRWIPLGFTTFQPSELAKFAVVLIFAHLISTNYDRMKDPKYGVWPFLALMGIVVLLMLLEPHLSGTILILGTGIVMMIVGGIQRWLVAAGLGGVGIVAVLYVQLVEKGIIQYGKGRIDTWRDPFNEAWFHGDGWQISQSLIAIGSGGLLGVGLGKSRQKFLYLPEEHNDCIFAVVCEELGLIGACVVMLLFALLILRGFWIALHAKDRFGTLMVVGIMTLISLQTFLNIAVVTGLIPATGISLPFFSYGGTALALQLFEMGIVLSVSRQIPAPRNG